MNVLETVIAIFLILIIISTFITEPKLSFEYFKAAATSAGKIIVKIKDTIKDWIGGDANDSGPAS